MSNRRMYVGVVGVWLVVALALPTTVAGQSSAAPQLGPTPAYDPERRAEPTEPDFRVGNLPSNLRLPRHRSNFTLTHRFAGNLRQGTFLDQLGDLFGLDRGASIGIEYRYAVMRHVQAVVFRTNVDKALQFSVRLDPVRQSATVPVSLSPIVSVEGSNNFRMRREPAIGVVVGRSFGTRLALYATPVWVHDTAAEAGLDMNTAFVGAGGRVRIGRLVYAVGEIAPRVSGYRPGDALYLFAIEKRVGGHVFQLNFTNAPATTFGQIARGGFAGNTSMGFNLSRKFF